MAVIFTHSESVAALREWTAALSAASSGSSYSIGGRTLTRQDITEIRSEIRRWHNTVQAHEDRAAGNVRPLGAVAEFPPAGGVGGAGIIPGSAWRSGST